MKINDNLSVRLLIQDAALLSDIVVLLLGLAPVTINGRFFLGLTAFQVLTPTTRQYTKV